jgi:hypothetical protein
MNSQRTGLRVAGVLFGLLAVAQIMRLIIRPEVLVAGNVMPLWPSAIALVVLGAMCLWMWRLASKPIG